MNNHLLCNEKVKYNPNSLFLKSFFICLKNNIDLEIFDHCCTNIKKENFNIYQTPNFYTGDLYFLLKTDTNSCRWFNSAYSIYRRRLTENNNFNKRFDWINNE